MKGLALHETPLAGGVEGQALHETPPLSCGQRYQTITRNEPILKHA